MGEVTSTIVVNFGDEQSSGSLVTVELDEQLNIGADGKVETQFYPGDQVYFLVHHDSTVRISSVTTTSGAVVSLGLVSRSATQQMLFKSLIDEQTLPHIPTSISAKWYGRNAVLSLVGDNKLTASDIPCIGDITHSYSAYSYVVSPPSFELAEDEQYFIGIVINIDSVVV